MYLRFLLLLTLSLPVFACNNAPATTENQTETPSEAAAEAEAAPVEPSAETPAVSEIKEAITAEAITPAQDKLAPKPVAVKTPKPTEVRTLKTPEADEKTTAQPAAEAPKPTPQPVTEQPKPAPAAAEKPAAPQPPSHEAWDKLLQQYVSPAGKVNYAGFKKDKAKLDAYLDVLQKNAPQNDWSRGEKMAFWINAYNAFTIKLIVDNYPVSSITKLDGGKPWDVKRISIGGKTYSLNNIENDILRPQFKDPRIHFAVNCAAKSCPPLLNRAWTAANLESNFEKQAKAFVNNPGFNKISAKEVEVSKIFDWYGSDFGNLIDYLNKYSTTKINANTKVNYKEYDWALNE